MEIRTPPPARTRTGNRTEEGLFRPEPQGSLDKALAKPGQLQKIAPASPRPQEMLEGVSVVGADLLTADDGALHELLVSAAYEADMEMRSATYSVDVSYALHYLGPDARRDSLRASLRRLQTTTVSYGTKSTRRYQDVPLLLSWLESTDDEDVICFQLPEPICVLMRNQPTFAYVELAALSTMRCKYSSRLYRVLALEAAKSKQKWEPGGDNRVRVEATPDEIAEWVGFPRRPDGTVIYGKLKERLLAFVDGDKEGDSPGDFAAVRKFSTEIVEHRKAGRGREVERVEFVLTLRPPSYHAVRVSFKPGDRMARVGGKDTPEYRVNSHIWRRAEKEFSRSLGMTHAGIYELWNIGLNEAISGEALSDGYGEREFRGANLLDAMRVHGADFAAWGFITEEAASPDLSESYGKGTGTFRMRAEAAEQARHGRIGFGKRRRAPAFVVADEDEGVPETVEAAEPAVTFEDCKEIVLQVDDALTIQDVESLVGTTVKKWTYTGSRAVYITLRYFAEGSFDRWKVGSFKVAEADLEGLLKRLSRYLDGPEEYVS